MVRLIKTVIKLQIQNIYEYFLWMLMTEGGAEKAHSSIQ